MRRTTRCSIESRSILHVMVAWPVARCLIGKPNASGRRLKVQ
jgi:hypothetical protein